MKTALHKKQINFNFQNIWKCKELYFLLAPAVLYIAIFNYIPMYGIVIAFKDFTPLSGISGSQWVGLKHFVRFISAPSFWSILRNTLTLSLYSLAAGFPLPIILALALNYTGNKGYKKFVQTVTYAPHFLSVVIVCSLCFMFLSPRMGVVNNLRALMGLDKIFYMAEPSCFKHIYVWSGIWQTCGWSSIIYMAALAGVDESIHESAVLDGATRLQRIWNIDLPCILPTIVTLLILNAGAIMNVGFEKTFLLQNSLNSSSSEIISTFVYKRGLQGGEYSFSTAVNLFNSLVNLILLVTVNYISRRIAEVSLW